MNLEDTETVEEELFNKFQDTLEEYYAWEKQTQKEFLASIYPNSEESEEEN